MMSNLYSGITQNQAASEQAKLFFEQGATQAIEAEREALRREKLASRFKARQAMLFVKSGVRLEGSPLLLLEETQIEAEKEVEAIRQQGRARQRISFAQGEMAGSEGRARLVGSLFEGVSSGLAMSSAIGGGVKGSGAKTTRGVYSSTISGATGSNIAGFVGSVGAQSASRFYATGGV
jgi:hypothetical protein